MNNQFFKTGFICALLVAASFAAAQIQTPGTPRTEPRGGGGGGVGVGINIDLGAIFSAIKNLQNNEDEPKNNPPALNKVATDVSLSTGGYTVNWVVQYANTSGAVLPSATVIDGPISTIIPGSLQQPPGWIGTTNSNPPAHNFAKWTGTNIAPHGVMTATLVAAGGGNFSVTGAGDGYQPIPYSHPSGPRIYLMNHHEAPGTALFDCIDATTGIRCPAGWPRKLPFGDGGADSSGTSGNNSEYVINGSKFYYPAQNFTKWGIGCFDLDTDAQCGFTKLGESSANPVQVKTMLQGPWLVNGELYLASYDGQVYCAKLAPGLPACLSSGYKIPLTTIKLKVPAQSSDALDWRNGVIAGKVVGKRLYLTSLGAWYADTGNAMTKYFNCFDAATKTACWATDPLQLSSSGTGTSNEPPPSTFAYNSSNYVYYKTNGDAQAICTRYNTVPKQKCTDLNNGAPIVLPVIFNSESKRLSHNVHIWPRTYFSETTGYTFAGVFQGWCWDWKAQDYCGANASSFSDGPAGTGDYGNNVDAQGCIWTYGHNSKLWSYDPNNIDPTTKKALPCGAGGKSVTVFQPLQYCSGPKPFKWTGIEVKGATHGNYTKFIVKVLDATTNAVLLTKNQLPNNAWKTDLSSIDAQTISKPLKIEIEYTPNPGVTEKPYLEVRYDAPPMEFCFQSKHTCEQTKITNTVGTPDPKNPGNIINVKVDVAAPANCTVTPPPPICGQPGLPDCPVCGAAGNPCPLCGQAGQPPCPVCGTATTLPCNACGLAGQPSCPCTAGMPNCGGGCVLGTPGCPFIHVVCSTPPCGRPPKICLTPPCNDLPTQSVIEELKVTKTACVRKPKAETPKPRPRVRPAVQKAPKVMAARAPTSPSMNAQKPKPKPKPKPRPVAAPKPELDADDCE